MDMRCAILLISLSAAVAMRKRPIVRVIGGTEDFNNEFPFAVILQVKIPQMVRICTGSLIAEEWVLTAGHCCIIKSHQMVVKYADATLPPNKTKAYAKVIEIYPHPSFKDVGYVQQNFNDIGLIKTERIYRPMAKLWAVDYKAWMGMKVMSPKAN